MRVMQTTSRTICGIRHQRVLYLSDARAVNYPLPNANDSNTPLDGDPLRFSNPPSLPFPVDAASRLASERSKRYDDLFLTIDETELRLRELASIMGMFMIDDDTPSAA